MGDIVLNQKQPDASYFERSLTPAVGRVMGFNRSKRPESVRARPFSYPARTAPNVWVPNGNLAVSHVNAVASSADGMRLAAADYSGLVWTSSNGGKNWILSGSGPGSWNCIASSENGMNLVVGEYVGYIYTSRNGGASWVQRVLGGTGSWACIACSADGQTIVASGSPLPSSGAESVHISRDGGSTWEVNADMGAGENFGVTCNRDGSIMMVVGVNGAWKSIDGGAHFTQINAAAIFNGIACSDDGMRIFLCGTASNISMSVDGGQTWTNPPPVANWTSVSCSLDGMRVVGTALTNVIYYSADGGTTYTAQESGSKAWLSSAISYDGLKILVSADFVSQVYLCDVTSVAALFGEDNASVWSAMGVGSFQLWTGIACSDDGMKLAASVYNGKVWTSDDGGLFWIERTGLPTSIWGLIVSSADGTKLAVSDISIGANAIWISDDGGENWTQKTTPITTFSTYGLVSSADGQKLAFLESASHVWTTTDRGTTWIERTSSPEGGLTLVCSRDGNKLILAGYSPGSIFISTDGGASWVEKNTGCGNTMSTLACSGDGMTIFAATSYNEPYISRDGGNTWNQLVGVGTKLWQAAAMSVDGMTISVCASSDEQIFISQDGGITWEIQSFLQANTNDSAMSADGTKIALSYIGYINILDFQTQTGGVVIPASGTWLYDMHILGVVDNYEVCRWHLTFAVQNTGVLTAIVGQIDSPSAPFDPGDTITADYAEFNGVVTVTATQPDRLAVMVQNLDGAPVDWSASGTLVEIIKSPVGGGSSGSS